VSEIHLKPIATEKKIFFTLIMNIQLFHCRMLSSLSQSLGFARAYELHNSITGARRRGVRDYIIVKKICAVLLINAYTISSLSPSPQ
jgi:hypothetical protein